MRIPISRRPCPLPRLYLTPLLLLAGLANLPGGNAFAQADVAVGQAATTVTVAPQSQAPTRERFPARDLLPSPEVQIPIQLPELKSERHPSEVKWLEQGNPLPAN